jgi:Ca2+-binding EF-hand superfamily protein
MSRTSHLTTQEEGDNAHILIDTLYDAFDANGDGSVDFSELAAGLSILCGGTSGMKTSAAFALYDINGDGFISFPEFQAYLLSVFKVMYRVQPSTELSVGVPVEELAAVTARDAFEEADLNHDGRLSYGEFKLWYESAHGSGVNGDDQDATSSTAEIVGPERYAIPFDTLDDIKKFTGLQKISAEQMFGAFERSVGGRAVGQMEFNDAFLRIVAWTRPDVIEDQDGANIVTEIATRLFETFDVNASGQIDPSSIKSGMSVLCGGDMHDKASAAFSLYDLNGDGYISQPEMI